MDDHSPARLWPCLDPEIRTLAARSLYDGSGENAEGRREADAAIARALRFRPTAVRRLPIEKRVAHLVRAVKLGDSLTSTLLLAFHLEHRRPLLVAFLEALGIPHQDGIIAEDHDLQPPEPEALGKAAAVLFERFPAHQVEVYLASLLAMDRVVWGGLADRITLRLASS